MAMTTTISVMVNMLSMMLRLDANDQFSMSKSHVHEWRVELFLTEVTNHNTITQRDTLSKLTPAHLPNLQWR